VVLPDGTQVWLNAASELRYPTRFTGNSREVTLTGEAYFEVAQLANQPFRVNTADLAVTVLGTGFNIMAYQNEETVHATLVQGSVKVSSTRMPQQTGIVLTPGQQASIVPGSAITVNRPDLNEVLSWKEGSFSFSKTSLQAIMRQIERWYDVEVVYEGSMPDFHFTGNFSRRQYASQLLEILEASGEVNFTIEKDKIIVKRGKR
jgi:ferric-dicitrate binding protein FerR (iron transport regulator)